MLIIAENGVLNTDRKPCWECEGDGIIFGHICPECNGTGRRPDVDEGGES
jgi:DnaJ-class molecular chaperone